MAQGLPRTRFNSSGLVRALAELTATETSEARQSFAERHLGCGYESGHTPYRKQTSHHRRGAPDVVRREAFTAVESRRVSSFVVSRYGGTCRVSV